MSAAPSAPSVSSTSAPRAPIFRERLSPGPAVVLVAAVGGAIFGVILVPISVLAAIVVALVLGISAAIGVVLTSPVVTVDDHEVQAGPASIDPCLLGEPEVLDRETWALTMGQQFEPLAYHCTRGWMHEGVRIPVRDDDDPTSAWVISSRRAEQLALAVEAARRGDGPATENG